MGLPAGALRGRGRRRHDPGGRRAPLGVHRRRRAGLRRGRLRRPPADDVPLLARRPPARAGRRAVDRPLQLPAARRPAGRPRRLAVWLPLLAARRPGGPGGRLERAAPARDLRGRPLHVPVAAGARRAAVGSGRGCTGLRARSLPRAPERRPPARVDRGARAAGALGLRAGASRGDGAGRAPLGRALRRRRRLGAALRPAPPRARRAPVRGRVRGLPLLAHRVALGLGRRARRRGCRADRRDRGHLRLDGVGRADARRGRLLLGEPARRPQPLAPARPRALRLPRLAPAGARRRRARAPGPPPPRSRDPAGARGAPARPARAGDEPAAVRDAPRRLSASALPARPRALPPAREPRPRGARRRRGRGRGRAVRGAQAGGGGGRTPRAGGRRPAGLSAALKRGGPRQRGLRAVGGSGAGQGARAAHLPARQGPVRERLPVLHAAGSAGAADRLRARSRGGVRVHRALQPPRLRCVAAWRP